MGHRRVGNSRDVIVGRVEKVVEVLVSGPSVEAAAEATQVEREDVVRVVAGAGARGASRQASGRVEARPVAHGAGT